MFWMQTKPAFPSSGNLTCTAQFSQRDPHFLLSRSALCLWQKYNAFPNRMNRGHNFSKASSGRCLFLPLSSLLFSFPFLGLGWTKPQSFQGKGQWNAASFEPSAWRVNQAALIIFICRGKLIIACSQVYFFFLLTLVKSWNSSSRESSCFFSVGLWFKLSVARLEAGNQSYF